MPKMPRGCSTVSARATATLAASYIAAGFVHGVLNSDNINITGESFDYGPWRFAPEWDEGFTAAYFDQAGLYAFGRQPEAIHWDVAQLAGCLAMIGEAPPLSDLLADWPARFEAALVERMLARLGVAARGDAEDRRWCRAMLRRCDHAMRRDRPLLLRLARRARCRRDEAYPADAVRRLARALSKAANAPLIHPYWSDPRPARC